MNDYIVIDGESGELIHAVKEQFAKEELPELIARWRDESCYNDINQIIIARLVPVKKIENRIDLTLDSD